MVRWTDTTWAVLSGALAFAAGSARAQGPDDLARQQQIQNIVRDRPAQAEAVARAFLFHVAPERGCHGGSCAVLDSLRARNAEAYWMEVAQLTVQFDMFQQVAQRDSARARQMASLFGTEFEARALQRAWRDASEPERRRMRGQLEALMTRHFEAEDQLRTLEARDIERRLADVRAETERRRARRAELVRQAVDDIINDANRAALPATQRNPGFPCYSLAVADWHRAIETATGLRGLPPFVGLDDTPLGPRGRRLALPPGWQHVGPYTDWASWRPDGATLILSFRGPTGATDVALRRAGSGYMGEIVTPVLSGALAVQVMLEPTTCEGLASRAR